MSKSSRAKLNVEPTKAELEILQVLWANGPSTVRFVHEELRKQRDVIYTSTLKQMQVMVEKGLLVRDEKQMKHVYKAADNEEKVKEHFLEKFVDSFYNGSPAKLAMKLLGNKKTSKQDLDSIREMLKKLENK
jgi:BlaI family transcriptional regulator, penicillinase repressor